MPEVILMMIIGCLLVSGAVISIRRFGGLNRRSTPLSEGGDTEKRLKYLEDMMQVKNEEIMKLKDEVRFLSGLLTDGKESAEDAEKIKKLE
jgi:hypothetical protein